MWLVQVGLLEVIDCFRRYPTVGTRRKFRLGGLSIRMVAGFAEAAERRDFFGCGGLQPSEFASPTIQIGTDSSRSVDSMKICWFY